MKTTVGMALSGGVDSATAAFLLQKNGYAVEAFFMELPLPTSSLAYEQATKIAATLRIPLHRLDLREAFTANVIDYFSRSYQMGLTPNPCVFCNHHIKFGLLAKEMQHLGMQYMATGHYARLEQGINGPILKRGLDALKDQSYFLARVQPSQLQQVFFPLGSFTKKEVRLLAQKQGIPFPEEESQDICFLQNGLTAFFAEKGLANQGGDIVTNTGELLGRHTGIWHYTIGQRRGLGLPDATPWYVLRIDGKENRLVVGKEEELLLDEYPVHSLRWVLGDTPPSWQGTIQLRSQHKGVQGKFCLLDEGEGTLTFASPQRAVTPGQFAVFYQEDLVVGSAILGVAKNTLNSIPTEAPSCSV